MAKGQVINILGNIKEVNRTSDSWNLGLIPRILSWKSYVRERNWHRLIICIKFDPMSDVLLIFFSHR